MIAGPWLVGWNRAFLVLYLAVTPAMAGSWESEPSETPENVTDRPIATLPTQEPSTTDSTNRNPPRQRTPSRWERFRNTLSPFRAKDKSEDTARPAQKESIAPKPKPESNPSPEDNRRRRPIGRKIQIEPEHDDGTTETERAKIDRRISQAAYEAEQVPD